MRKSSLLLLSGLVLLAGCKATAPVSESAKQSSSTSAKSTTATPIWGLFDVWAPEVSWTAPAAGTNKDAILIDEGHTIPAGAMQTSFITSTISVEEFAKTFASGTSRSALDSMLELSGWTPHISLDADGATGTQWGYKMQSDAGLAFLIVSAMGKDCSTPEDAPMTCSTYTATVSQTDAIAEGDDL